MRRGIVVLLLALTSPAGAGELPGGPFPPSLRVPGATLRLNGSGPRLYSVFQVRVYEAALYLEQRSHDGAAILASDQRKAITVRALRAVAAGDVGAAWRDSFAENCRPPCRIPPEADAFVASVAASRKGGTETYLFDQAGVRILVDGRATGAYGPAFAQLLLATFIGASPPTESLKRALLGDLP